MYVDIVTSNVFNLNNNKKKLFSHVFIFRNMFPESRGFVAVPVTRPNNLKQFR